MECERLGAKFVTSIAICFLRGYQVSCVSTSFFTNIMIHIQYGIILYHARVHLAIFADQGRGDIDLFPGHEYLCRTGCFSFYNQELHFYPVSPILFGSV